MKGNVTNGFEEVCTGVTGAKGYLQRDRPWLDSLIAQSRPRKQTHGVRMPNDGQSQRHEVRGQS
jgi:hypothetical protein